MRKWILLTVLLFLLTGQAAASEVMEAQADYFGVEALEKGLPQEAEEILGDRSPTEQANFTDGVTEIFARSLSQSGTMIRSAASMMLRVLLIVIVCRMVETGEGEHISRASALAGALAVTACCVTDVQGLIGLGKHTMEEIMSFSDLLMPVMASASAASGSVSGAGMIYSVTVLFSNFLMKFFTSILMPVIYGILALSLADCAMQESRLKKLRELLSWFVRFGLKTVMYLFTGFLAVTGVLSGTADAAALKAAKVTISGMVPVVGGIISDAAETVLAGADVLKGAIGTFGMLAVLAVFTLPFLRMGVHYLALKLASALSGTLGSNLSSLLDAVTEAMGFLLAMTGSSVLMCLLSCICFMRVVRL